MMFCLYVCLFFSVLVFLNDFMFVVKCPSRLKGYKISQVLKTAPHSKYHSKSQVFEFLFRSELYWTSVHNINVKPEAINPPDRQEYMLDLEDLGSLLPCI